MMLGVLMGCVAKLTARLESASSERLRCSLEGLVRGGDQRPFGRYRGEPWDVAGQARVAWC